MILGHLSVFIRRAKDACCSSALDQKIYVMVGVVEMEHIGIVVCRTSEAVITGTLVKQSGLDHAVR